ncbi:hypothetical protein TNCV_3708951 [Trichonephila clavipes]|nr:hypothetical protein TNCV_3708951 [Trichonephila clavipes]
MRRPSMSQTCSIGFRSGEHAGHSIRCIVSASSMFSTRRALCGRALSSWKTKESPMAPASVRPPMLFPPHTIQPALLYCDLSRTNAGLFRVPLSLHSRTRRVSHSRLKRDSYVNSTCSNHVAPNLDVQQPIFFGPHGGVGSTECRPLAYVHRALPHEADTYCLAEHPSSCGQEQLSLQLRSILCSVSTGC